MKWPLVWRSTHDSLVLQLVEQSKSIDKYRTAYESCQQRYRDLVNAMERRTPGEVAKS